MEIRSLGVAGVLSADLTATATSVSSACLANLAAVASPDTAKLTLFSLDASGNIVASEVVSVTAHAAGATTATVVRAQEGTTAAAWNGTTSPSAHVAHGPTPGDWAALTRLRTTVTHTTASLAAAAQEYGTLAMAAGWRGYRLSTSAAARVRLYTTAAKRNADETRPVGTAPTGDHGVMLDYVTTSTVLAADLGPVVDGFNEESPVTSNIAYTIDNLSGAAAAITVTLTYIQTE